MKSQSKIYKTFLNKCLLLVPFLIPTLVFGQAFPTFPKNENGIITYTRIIHNDSLNQKQLYGRIKDIGASIYKSAEVMQADNPPEYIAYRGFMPEFNAYEITKFYIKDGKVKVEITQITKPQNQSTIELPIEGLIEKDSTIYQERLSKGKKYSIVYWYDLNRYVVFVLDYIESQIKKNVDF